VTFDDRAIRVESYVKAFRAAEPSMIDQLGGETRMFAREHPRPTSADDPFGPAWVARPFVDPFSFTEREAALVQARRELEALAIPPALEAELFLSHADPPEIRAIRVEQDAMRRLLAAESDRLERERTLPGRAGDLLRTIRLTWPMSASAGARHDLESTVTWRLENLRQALAPGSLSTAERDDAADALADLAPLLAPLPHAAAESAKLRTALDALWTAPYPTEDEREMDKELDAYVGAPVPFDALDGAFVSAARAFDLAIDAGFSVLDEAAQARVRARARRLLASAPPCQPRVPIRTVLDLAPPDERAFSCALLHATSDARSDEDELAADLAWRDAIVVARWAVSTHGPLRSKEAALRLGTLGAGESPSEAAALFRMAVARPLRAIAAGVAASILTREGGAHIRIRAQKWRALGDAPMDLVAPLLTPENLHKDWKSKR
jgi:hypothetical protein